jgi:OFA family oxalate/formate antiporter-like MFS transporter
VIFPIGNGLSRIVSGSVSDKLGREKTMMIFFGSLGLTIIALVQFGGHPVAFVILVFVAALLGGSPFALYPATIGDYYGSKYSTVNYGITYTAKAWAGLISGWLSGFFVVQFGSFKITLLLIAIGSLLAAVISSPKLMRPPAQKP